MTPSELINLEGKTCSRSPVEYPKNVIRAKGAFINDQVVICGGWGREPYENVEECYTLKKGDTSWTLLGKLNFMDSSSSSVVVNNIFYAIGGTGPDHCSTIESISLDGTTTLESITVNGNVHQNTNGPPWENYCIGGQASVTINSTTSITMGGSNGGWYIERTWYYNGETFSEGPDLITGRWESHAAGLLRDKDTNEEYIAVVGGRNIDWKVEDSLELLKIGDNKWKSGMYLLAVEYLCSVLKYILDSIKYTQIFYITNFNIVNFVNKKPVSFLRIY